MSTADLRQARVRLERALFPLRQRALVVGLFFAVAIAALVVIAMLLLGMWVDLTVPLSVGIRRLVVPLAVISAVAFAIALMRQASLRSNLPSLARRVDDVSHSGGRVMTGFDLTREDQPEQSSLADGLALLAAEQAEDVCDKVDEVEAVPADNARYWWKVVGATALCLCIFAGLVPRMAWTQVQRILVPMESQLPYSPTAITVDPGDAQVLYGDDLEVIAMIDGPLVEDLELVLNYADGREEPLPMLAETDDRWRTFLTRITEPAEYHVRGGSARSRSHQLQVKMTPQITEVQCRIEQPEYTRRGIYEGPIPESGIEGLAGSTVTLSVQSNRPLSSGEVKLEMDDDVKRIALNSVATSVGSQAVEGSFELTRGGRFSIAIVDRDGIPSSESLDGILRILPDHAPVVRLLQPKPISLATPDVHLPVVIAAEDDYEISRMELFRGLNGSPPLAKVMLLEEVSASTRVSHSLPLAAYGLQPGDEITLFARVEDNDPSGAKGAESPVHIVRIISREQLAQLEMSKRGVEALLSKQRQVQRMLASLQEKMQEAADAAGDAQQKAAEAAADAGNAEAQMAAAEAQQKAAQAMAKANEAMNKAATSTQRLGDHPLPVDVDQGMSEQLKELAAKLSKAAERLQELTDKVDSGQQLSQEEQQDLKDLMEQMGAAKKQHQQQSMEPTEQLAKTFPLVADQQRFTQLARRQRSLAQRLDALRAADPSDPAVARRADDLRREQQQLQVALSQLLEDIQSHAKQLPDDPEFDKLRQTANEFVRNVRSSRADPSMTSTQQELLGGNASGASENASTAADILESFLSQCNGMGGQACKNCESGFNPSAGSANLGNSLQQLLDSLGLGQGQTGRKPGMSAGMGPGGGYSMPQNTAENIGLYGGLPTEVASPRSGEDGDKSEGAIASYTQGGDAKATAGSESTSEATARGDAAAGVPSLYREQVNEYFRQLADELGDL